ncbi:heme peroxidase [Mycena sanguinolenta]|nr:heme peroxidase [Mycena sanguinolenta]
MRYSLLILLTCICPRVLGATPAVFHWPDPAMDTMDVILYQPGNPSTIPTLPLDCFSDDNTTVSAQWLRIAYHDAASHDSIAGTGGLDASIMFELDRPQNIGRGMIESLQEFEPFGNQYVGMADLIAMGAINAVIGCGGPVIPFRGGRVDATEAGPETVPEPQQDLVSHTAAFARMGFNATEMISLVACGHSLGGVRQVDFPLIVTEDVPTGVQNFSSTIGFNNTVVLEYLDSTTQNVLVVGSNVTTRSDMRIFSSDGNVTMQSLASPNTFNQVCVDLIERMINLVPSIVTLTDPIEPIDFKVFDTVLYPVGGSLPFLAKLRVIDSDLNRTVTMFWKERTGTFCPEAGCFALSSQVQLVDSSFLASLKGVTGFTVHSFNASIDLATSISHFWFEVNNNDGSAPSVVDNHGANYTIDQDVLLFDPDRSSDDVFGFNLVVAVRHLVVERLNCFNHFSLAQLKDVSGTVTTTLQGNDTATALSTVTSNFQLNSSFPPLDGYTFYSASISTASGSNTVHATVNDTVYSLWVPRPLPGSECESCIAS